MNLTNTQISTIYDSDPNMTIESLAAGFGFDEQSVKMVLAASSQRYRKEMAESDVFTQDDRKLAAETLKQLMFAESEVIRMKVAQTVLDRDSKGDDKRIKATARTVGTININVLAGFIDKGRQRLKEAKGEVITLENAKPA
jgi:hypothetical protein